MRRERVSDSRIVWVLFLWSLSLYLSTSGGHLYSRDEELRFRLTESLATFRGIAVKPLEPALGFQDAWGTRTGRGGREYTQYGVGQSLLAVPLYWVGMGLDRLLPDAVASTLRPDTRVINFRTPQEFKRRLAVSWYGQIIGALSVVSVYLVGRTLYDSQRIGLTVALLYGTCTMVWPTTKNFMSELTVAFLVVMSFYFLLRFGRRAPSHANFTIAGAFAGYALLTRTDAVLLLVGPSLYALCLSVKRCRPFSRAMALYAAPVLAAIVFSMALNWYLYGDMLTTGYHDHQEIVIDAPMGIGLGGFLFSPGKSIFVFSPILLLAILGIPGLYRRERLVVVCLTFTIVPLMCIMAKWKYWYGGADWGPRHVFPATPFLCFFLGIWLTPGQARFPRALRGASAVLAGVSVFVQLLGVSCSALDSYLQMPLPYAIATQWFEKVYCPEYSLPWLQVRTLWALRHDLMCLSWLTAPLGLWRLLALAPLAGFLAACVGLYRVLRGVRDAERPSDAQLLPAATATGKPSIPRTAHD